MKHIDKFVLIGVVSITLGALLYFIGMYVWSFNEFIEAQKELS